MNIHLNTPKIFIRLLEEIQFLGFSTESSEYCVTLIAMSKVVGKIRNAQRDQSSQTPVMPQTPVRPHPILQPYHPAPVNRSLVYAYPPQLYRPPILPQPTVRAGGVYYNQHLFAENPYPVDNPYLAQVVVPAAVAMQRQRTVMPNIMTPAGPVTQSAKRPPPTKTYGRGRPAKKACPEKREAGPEKKDVAPKKAPHKLASPETVPPPKKTVRRRRSSSRYPSRNIQSISYEEVDDDTSSSERESTSQETTESSSQELSTPSSSQEFTSSGDVKDASYQCGSCDKVCGTKNGLKQHKRVHNKLARTDPSFSCSDCGVVFTTRYTAMRHMALHHQQKTKPEGEKSTLV